MSFADGTVKKGLFENNVFIEEIIDEDAHEDDNSILVEAKKDKADKSNKASGFKKKKRIKKPPTGEDSR